MLGKNNITRIRNLDSLKHLEMLDLHTNKITKIENIKHLSGLRVLNISNNSITAIENLNGLTSLNELNARKNIITSISGLEHCPQLKKLFLSQNKIEMFDKIKNLKEAKVLEELAIDQNPIASNAKTYVSFCFTKVPSLKSLDGKKESDYRELKAFPLEDGKSGTESTQPTPDKNLDHAGDDISPDNLLRIISVEWKNEMKRLKEKGLNGYKKRKDSKQESCVQSGHAEIEGVSMLFIYGNAIEVLEKAEFQKSVEEITFQYMRFNTIVGSTNMKKLRKFEKLRKLTFMDNNIHSFVQISKLEAINSLRSLSITNNDVHLTCLCRCFIVYRFPFVTEINNKFVNDEEKTEARTQFQNFDKILSTQKFYPTRVIQERSRDDSSSSHQSGRNTRQFMKRNNESAHEFVNNLLDSCIKQEKVMQGFYNDWEDIMKVYVTKAVEELYNNNDKDLSLKAKY
jgi:leucine-rich repeat-containing protein 49